MKKKGKCEELGFKEHYGDVPEVLSQIEKYEDYRVIWKGIKARLFHNLLPDGGAAIYGPVGSLGHIC